jgi:pimeloyl-ACP methyl ester carboxylesterase
VTTRDDGVRSADPATWDAVGPPGAEAIVLIHGTRLTRAGWKPQADRLAGEFRVILPDLPGHGVRAAERFTLEGAADVVAQAIDEVAGGRAIVVGLSLGGYVSLVLAARSPERVRGLVLAGASQEPVGGWSIPYRALELLFAHAPRRQLDALNRAFFRLRFPPPVSDPIIAGGFWPDGGAEALRAIRGRRFVPLLATYSGPTLILNGSLDVIFRLGERRFVAAAQDGRRHVIAGATHLVNLDRPDAVTDAIRTFARGPVARAEASRSGAPPPPVILTRPTN